MVFVTAGILTMAEGTWNLGRGVHEYNDLRGENERVEGVSMALRIDCRDQAATCEETVHDEAWDESNPLRRFYNFYWGESGGMVDCQEKLNACLAQLPAS